VRNKLAAISLAAVGFLALCVPLFAHHGNSSYDSAKTVTVKGTVTEYIWANPHVFLKVDAKDDNGITLHWIIEAQNPVSQIDVGWSKTTFKPGDEVIVDSHPRQERPANRTFHAQRAYRDQWQRVQAMRNRSAGYECLKD
jgi:hypothetical protein